MGAMRSRFLVSAGRGRCADGADLLIGIDSGTSVVKAVAFDLGGRQVASAAILNRYVTGADGAASQSLEQTWPDCAQALHGAGREGRGFRAPHRGDRGDGAGRRHLAGRARGMRRSATPGSGSTRGRRRRWRGWARGRLERARFEATGTGLNTCQQGAQFAQMRARSAEMLDRAEVALHCKDWLYLCLTGVRATDPSEASWTFGNFRTRRYDDTVIAALGLSARRGLLPEIVDGTEITHPLTEAAARATGLAAGTPVSLGYVDMVMTALGAGVHTGDPDAACTVIGSTGVHLRSKRVEDVTLNAEGTGYVMALPVPGYVTQMQTNMAAALNIDWALRLAADLMAETGREVAFSDLVSRIEPWLAASRPGAMLYHPYISEAGERGPFVDANARAGFIGLTERAPVPGFAAGGGGGAGAGGAGLLCGDGGVAVRVAAERRGGAVAVAARGAGGGGAGAGPGVGPRGGGCGGGGDDGGGGGGGLPVDGCLHRAMGDAAARGGGGAGPGAGRRLRAAVSGLCAGAGRAGAGLGGARGRRRHPRGA